MAEANPKNKAGKISPPKKSKVFDHGFPPTQALVFGDRKDADSQVSKSMNDPRAYRVLGELNTDPSVIYLKKVDEKA